jgi:hypothetical protein
MRLRMLQMARVGASNVTVGTGDYDISGIANCDESRNCRGTAACDNSLGLPLNSRPPRSLMCRFRMPGWRDYPRAPVAGVRKAPRHEIAGRGRQQCRGCYGDLATSSGAPVMTRSGSETRFAG